MALNDLEALKTNVALIKEPVEALQTNDFDGQLNTVKNTFEEAFNQFPTCDKPCNALKVGDCMG